MEKPSPRLSIVSLRLWMGWRKHIRYEYDGSGLIAYRIISVVLLLWFINQQPTLELGWLASTKREILHLTYEYELNMNEQVYRRQLKSNKNIFSYWQFVFWIETNIMRCDCYEVCLHSLWQWVVGCVLGDGGKCETDFSNHHKPFICSTIGLRAFCN